MTELLSFTLANCPPAKLVEETVAGLLPELNSGSKTEIQLIKIEADNNKELTDKFLVSSVPTLIVIKEEKEIGRILGFYPKDGLKTKLKKLLV